MNDDMEALFGKPEPYIEEKFEEHTLTLTLLAGEGEGFKVDVECKAKDNDHSVCTSKLCMLDDLIKSVGFTDIVKAAGDIELGKLSAKVDWRDPEEPWVEVEP